MAGVGIAALGFILANVCTVSLFSVCLQYGYAGLGYGIGLLGIVLLVGGVVVWAVASGGGPPVPVAMPPMYTQAPVPTAGSAPPSPGLGYRCLRCGAWYAGPGFCPRDEVQVVPVVPNAAYYVCPRCGTPHTGPGYCFRDSTPLIPGPAAVRSAPGGLFCPVCGERYSAGVRFCPRDATELKEVGQTAS